MFILLMTVGMNAYVFYEVFGETTLDPARVSALSVTQVNLLYFMPIFSAVFCLGCVVFTCELWREALQIIKNLQQN
jgi:hypothetical protein